MIAKEDVVRTHTQEFYGALKAGDFDALSNLYAEDYMLVRPDGSVLSKPQVLRDLQVGGLIFQSIDLTDINVRIYGETALLAGESRTVTSRNGQETSAHFRLVAVYIAERGGLRLAHFQSTSLPV
jgi:ketosteroid isomerase-like protein